MKILHVVQFFSPNHGGSAMVPYEMTKELARRGHEVTVLTTDYRMGDDFVKGRRDWDVVVARSKWEAGGLIYSPDVKRLLDDMPGRFDIVHLHNYRTYQNIVASQHCLKHDVPYVLQAHGSLLPVFQKRALKIAFDLVYGNRILKNASRVVAINDLEAGQYRKKRVGNDRIRVIPNGIDAAEFEHLPPGGRFRERFGVGETEKLVLFLGRVHKIKGIDLLIHAFAGIVGRIPDARLVIVGPDGGYTGSARELASRLNIADRVTFTGPLYGRDRLDAYVDSDVCVLPSYYEIFGLTAIEACACGKPVVVSENCGVREYIEDCGGKVVKLCQQDLAEAIGSVLDDRAACERLAAVGRRMVSKKLSWQAISESFESLYDEVI